MIKNKLLTLFLLLTAQFYSAHAQNFNQHVIGSGGNCVSNSGNQLTYTIGEAVIPTFKAGNNTFTQGFNQPSNLIINAVHDVNASFTLTTYPNPSQDVVNIDITGQLTAPLSMEMFDDKGAKIYPSLMQNDQSKIRFNMEEFAAGYYSIRLTNRADNTSSTIKIVKIH